MLNSTDLLKTIKKAAVEAVNASNPASLMYGTVQSVSPLTIYVDQKLILPESFIIVPQHLTDYETEITFDNPDIKQIYTTWDMQEREESTKAKISFKQPSVKHKITVYNALKTGDKVLLLRQQGGQKFLVLDRVVV